MVPNEEAAKTHSRGFGKRRGPCEQPSPDRCVRPERGTVARVRRAVGFATVALAASTTGTAATADAVCDAASARAALNGYVQAFNGGHYARLQCLFAPEPEFAWYAVAPPHGRTNRQSQDRSTLMAYFRARHLKREILRVVDFNFASTQTRDGAVTSHFNGRLTRKALDLPLERRGFKATIRCGSSTQFIVLSIGTKI